jgi:chemotaxis protein histidine kinase CheA
MPLDERIQRLSETIIQEVRGPIEEALHRLLADVMTLASEERDKAVQSALDAAAADSEAALATLREQAERERAEALALSDQSAGERDTALASLREELERGRDTALADLRSELGGDREAAMADLREELERKREEQLSALRTQLDHERDTMLADLRARLERERDEAAASSSLTTALADAEHAKHDLEARATALEQDLEQARREAEEARRAAGDAQREAGDAQRAAEQARAEADQARADASAAEMSRRNEAEARQSADVARQMAEDAQQQAGQARQAAEQSLLLTHAADRQQELACSDRTLAAFRKLDEARSLTAVLRVLADQAEHEIGRVALLLVIGSRLRGWEWRGLAGTDAAIDVPIDPGTVFDRAIASGFPVSTSDAPLGADGDPLAALLAIPPGRVGLAVPISVGGRVVAILYADDAGDRTPVVPSTWPELAEILARHAGRCLEALTVSHASALAGRAQDDRVSAAPRHPDEAMALADEQSEEESARRYARLLISEIKLYNETAVEQGRAERDLLTRLGPEIERARRLYEEKIPAAVRQRVECFDEEVVRTLAGGDAGLLGQT